MNQGYTHINEVDLNNLRPRLHNNCWVVADARKWHGDIRKNSLVQGGAIFTETDALKLAEQLNQTVAEHTFGKVLAKLKPEIRGPFYAYRLATAKGLGLL